MADTGPVVITERKVTGRTDPVFLLQFFVWLWLWLRLRLGIGLFFTGPAVVTGLLTLGTRHLSC